MARGTSKSKGAKLTEGKSGGTATVSPINAEAARAQTAERSFELAPPRDDRPTRPPVDQLDPISQRMRPEFTAWRATGVQFDWARKVSGERFFFTRWYYVPGMGERAGGVIVDMFAQANPTAAKEIAQKTAIIAQQNVTRAAHGIAPIGYLPVVRGRYIDDQEIARAKSGELLEMITRKSPFELGGLVAV